MQFKIEREKKIHVIINEIFSVQHFLVHPKKYETKNVKLPRGINYNLHTGFDIMHTQSWNTGSTFSRAHSNQKLLYRKINTLFYEKKIIISGFDKFSNKNQD